MNASDVIAGRYRLERLLGTGGMAEVWLAEDTRLERLVALKALNSSVQDADALAAFEREARVIAKLQHPNIVGVFDSGTHDGREFIVMEYVHGYSLRELLESQRRFTEPEAVRYGVQVAQALQYAHEHGVVHCDVKPENVLVNENGVAKVADFGVAEALNRTMAPGQAQDLLGTVAYLAPEIIEGAAPSPASDIYSLGLTIYEMVAGRLPFAGSTPGATIGQRLAAPATPLRAYARGASPELEAVLSRALALSPQDRYQSASAFATALQRVPNQSPARVAPVAVPPGRAPTVQRRHTTARVTRRPAAAAAGGGISGVALLLIIGIVLAAAGVGIAAAVVLSNAGDDDKGGVQPSPTPVASMTSKATATQQAQATATTAPQPSPTPETSPSATATTAQPTAAATATKAPNTPTTAPPTATPKPSATAAATAAASASP